MGGPLTPKNVFKPLASHTRVPLAAPGEEPVVEPAWGMALPYTELRPTDSPEYVTSIPPKEPAAMMSGDPVGRSAPGAPVSEVQLVHVLAWAGSDAARAKVPRMTADRDF